MPPKRTNPPSLALPDTPRSIKRSKHNKDAAQEGAAKTATTIDRDDQQSWVLSPVISILVGSTRAQRFVHIALFNTYSAYLKDYLESGNSEESLQQIFFTKLDIENVDVFLVWLYTGHLKLGSPSNSQNLTRLMNLYQLGDSLMSLKFSNAIIDKLHSVLKSGSGLPTSSDVTALIHHDMHNSRFGKLCLRTIVWSIHHETEDWILGPDLFDARTVSQELERVIDNDHAAAVEILRVMIQYAQNSWANPRLSESKIFHKITQSEA